MSTRFVERDACVRAPELLARIGIERLHVLFFALLALNEQAATGDCGGRVAFAQTLDFPDQRWSAFRPGFEQAGLGGDAIAIRSAPLGPIISPHEGSEKEAEED
jgi:hypothetical protein